MESNRLELFCRLLFELATSMRHPGLNIEHLIKSEKLNKKLLNKPATQYAKYRHVKIQAQPLCTVCTDRYRGYSQNRPSHELYSPADPIYHQLAPI
jgi:hypothetical protein